MQSQLQQAIRASTCKLFDKVPAYCKTYGMPFNKQYGMLPMKQPQSFIDLKIPRSKVNECLSIRSYRKTDYRHAISYQHLLDTLDNGIRP